MQLNHFEKRAKPEQRFMQSVVIDPTHFRIAVDSDIPVLLQGATGTGKTSLARQIHNLGPRSNLPFVGVNLASLHEGTLESELFGHEKGSFTGAESRRSGRIESAQGGTLFLDEVGDLSLKHQARLLEFLQNKTIVPVGSNREIKLNVRVLAATHKNLEKSVRDREFREDLFHRLRFLAIEMPAIKDYESEVFDRLVHQILAELAESRKKSILRISEEVALRLECYPWPGNIRELRSVLEFAVLACEGDEILLNHLPSWFVRPQSGPLETEGALGRLELPIQMDFLKATSQFEKEYLKWALGRFGGRVNLTARKTGMNKATLIRKMRELGLSRSEFFGF